MMKALTAALFLTFSLSAFSWTPQLPTGKGFHTKNITIYVADADCPNTGLQVEDMVTYVEEAIDMYWGKAGSGLKLKYGGTRKVSLDGDKSIGDTLPKTPYESIIVGCNDDLPAFAGGKVLGMGGLGCYGKQCRGAVTLNDTKLSHIPRMPHARVLMVFAHELGHALGLGHSELPAALMYYSLGVKLQEDLHADDITGIRALYPIK